MPASPWIWGHSVHWADDQLHRSPKLIRCCRVREHMFLGVCQLEPNPLQPERPPCPWHTPNEGSMPLGQWSLGLLPPALTLASPTCPRSLTLLLKGCGVQLQVVQAEAGPGRVPQAAERWPAGSAPQLHCAVVVLGDDGAVAAACRRPSRSAPAGPPRPLSREAAVAPTPLRTQESPVIRDPRHCWAPKSLFLSL